MPAECFHLCVPPLLVSRCPLLCIRLSWGEEGFLFSGSQIEAFGPSDIPRASGDKNRGQIVSPLLLSPSRLSTGGQCSLVDFGRCNIVEDLVCIGFLIQRLLEKV